MAERSQERHAKACNELETLLHGMMFKGLLADGKGKGMIMSYVASIECVNEDGSNEMEVLWTPNRVNITMGNLQYANLYLIQAINGNP